MIAAWSLGAAPAEWYVDYDNGVKALQAGRFDEAVRLLESAVAARPEPSTRARTYGQRYIEYYPYFYLGKAYQRLGNSSKAREMLESSERLKELERNATLAAERGQLLQGTRVAQVTTAPPPTTAASPATTEPPALSTGDRERIETAIASAKTLTLQGKPGQARSELEALQSSLPATPAAESYRRDATEAMADAGRRQDQAKEALQAGLDSMAQKAYPEARRHLNRALELDQSRGEAREALDRLKREEASAASGEFSQALAQARGALVEGKFDVARQRLNDARRFSPQSPELERLAADIRRAESQATVDTLIKEGRLLFESKKYEEANAKFGAVLQEQPGHAAATEWMNRVAGELRGSLDQKQIAERLRGHLQEARDLLGRREIGLAMEKVRSAQALDPGSRDLAEVGRQATEAARLKAKDSVTLYLQGRYADAMSSLEDSLAALSDRPTAHLYLAWACYARYLADGETDSALADKARAEMREALRLDPKIQPDPRVVSPRLVSVLEQVRSEKP